MKKISGDELDRLFDEGEVDILQYFDASEATRPNLQMLDEPKKVNITLPSWMVKKLDEEASHLAISRQAVISTWIAEMIERKNHVHA